MKKNNKPPTELNDIDRILWKKVTRDMRSYAENPPEEWEEMEEESEEEELFSMPRLKDIRDLIPDSAEAGHHHKPLSVGDVTTIDKNTAEKFKKGKLKINAKLDLHGLTQEEAFPTLYQFIRDCYDSQKRIALVITGKGARADTKVGVLQQNTPRWLNTPGIRECIVAITHALPKDGGDGALYVFIRRLRPGRD